MKKLKMIPFFVVAVMLILQVATFAESFGAYDYADIFSDTQEAYIKETCARIKSEYNVDVIIHTEESVATTRDAFVDVIYMALEDDINMPVIMLIDMDPNDRGVQIKGYGESQYYMKNERIESTLDVIVPYLSSGAYDTASTKFLEEVEYYLNLDPYHEPIPHLQNLVLALVAAAVVLIILVYKSSAKVTTNQRTYADPMHTRVVGSRDTYLRTVTTKTHKPKSSSSSGGGGGGSSLGGGSSSGGRSF